MPDPDEAFGVAQCQFTQLDKLSTNTKFRHSSMGVIHAALNSSERWCADLFYGSYPRFFSFAPIHFLPLVL